MNPVHNPANEPIVRPRMPELDTVRGIAILAVVLFHGFGGIAESPHGFAFWQRAFLAITWQGWAGVNLFFVLSGFLITGILLDSAKQRTYYSRFYSHRALRILPAYYGMLLLIFVWNYFTGVSTRVSLAFTGVSFVYLANLAPLFGIATLYPLLWSLAVEEHFYLVWPAVVRRLTRRSVAAVALAICVVEPVLRFYALQLMSVGENPWWGASHRGGSFFYTWMTADGLALGALLAVFARSAWGSRKNFARLSLLTFAASLLGSVLSMVIPLVAGVCLRGTLINYFALTLVSGALWLGTGKYRAWANIRVLSFYGYISYGLYLIHGWMFGVYQTILRAVAPSLLPGSDFAKHSIQFAICLGAATAMAYGSRLTYEEYFLRLKNRAAKAAAPTNAAAAA